MGAILSSSNTRLHDGRFLFLSRNRKVGVRLFMNGAPGRQRDATPLYIE